MLCCSGRLVCGGVSGGWGEHGWDDYRPVDSCLTLDTRTGDWVLSHNLTVSRWEGGTRVALCCLCLFILLVIYLTFLKNQLQMWVVL